MFYDYSCAPEKPTNDSFWSMSQMTLTSYASIDQLPFILLTFPHNKVLTSYLFG